MSLRDKLRMHFIHSKIEAVLGAKTIYSFEKYNYLVDCVLKEIYLLFQFFQINKCRKKVSE